MHFGILGPLSIDDGGRRVEITAPKQRALLILLLLEAGHVVPAEVILDRLWPDNPPSGGLKTVRFHVSKVRDVLEPGVKGSGFSVLETRDAGYYVDPTRHEIDSRRFDRLATEGHREVEPRPDRAQRLLSEALDLWRGPALQDVAYEDFAAPESRRLEARKLTVTEDRVSSELRLGRTAGVVAELEELAAANPLRERTTELLMQALYASGRSAEAISAAQTLRKNLGELGLEPPPSLVQLEEQILVHDESLAAPTAPTLTQAIPPLPARLTSFIGRTAEIRHVEEAVAQRRLVTLVGPPGSGKTRLALEVGRTLGDQFAEGAGWVELADVTTPSLLPQAVSGALGIVAPIGADYTELVLDHLRERQVLLLIDNCEHILDEAARLLLAILETCPDVKILATSREALGVPGEHTWTVPPFELPRFDEIALSATAEADSVRLFVDRAREADSRFTLTDENVVDVAAICVRLDGLPLAIELAASATEALTPRQIVARLDRRFVDVPATRRHAVSRQATMEQAVRWSYDLLNPIERAIFARLSVFSGGFTMEAAEAVAGWGRVDKEDVFDAVLHLVHMSLLVPTHTSDDQIRYRMLMVLRQFGQRELQAEGDAAAVDERHADHYASVAEAIAPHIEGPTASRASEIANIELENFRTAMESSITRDRCDVALRIDAALTWHWYWRSHIEEGLRWGTRILEAAPEGEPTAARAQVLYAVGIFQTITGRYADANATFESASEMARGLGLEQLEARTLAGRGVNARDRGRLSASQEYLHAAEEISRRTDDVGHLALTLRFVGVTRYLLGDLAGAKAALDEAYDLFSQAGHRGGMGWAKEGLASVAFRSDEDGFSLAEEAAALYSEVHDRRNQAWLLIRTAIARLNRNLLEEAAIDLAESRALFAELNDKRGLAYAEQHLGMLELARDNLIAAGAKLRTALARFEEIGDESGVSGTHGWLAVLAVRIGDDEAAGSELEGWSAHPVEDRYAWGVLDVLTAMVGAAREAGLETAPIEQVRDNLDAALAAGEGVATAIQDVAGVADGIIAAMAGVG